MSKKVEITLEKKVATKKNTVSKQRKITKRKSIDHFMPKSIFDHAERFKRPVAQSNVEKIEQEVKDSIFLNEIWNRIDKKLYYPDIFDSAEVRGDASVFVSFGEKGVLDKNGFRVEGSNRHIKAFVKMLVFEALKSPLRKSLWTKDFSNTLVELEFNFIMKHTPGTGVVMPGGVRSVSHLNFRRSVVNPRIHPIKKAVPILGPGGLDLVEIYGRVSGTLKDMKKQIALELESFTRENLRISDAEG